MDAYLYDLLTKDITNLYGENIFRSGIFPPIEHIEDVLARMKNPLLVIPENLVGTFLSHSGNFKRNPYAFRPYENKYFLYHRFIDTQTFMFGDNKIERIIAVERDENNKLIKDDYFLVDIFN